MKKILLTALLGLGLTFSTTTPMAQSNGVNGSGMLNADRELNRWYNFQGEDIYTHEKFIFSMFKVAPTFIETNYNGKFRFDLKLTCNLTTNNFQFAILTYDEFTNNLIREPHKFDIQIKGSEDFPVWIGAQPISGGIVYESKPALIILYEMNQSDLVKVSFRSQNGRIYETEFNIKNFLDTNLAFNTCMGN